VDPFHLLKNVTLWGKFYHQMLCRR